MPKLKYLTINLKKSNYDQKWTKEQQQQRPFVPKLKELKLHLNYNIDCTQIISLLTESTAKNFKTIIINYESLYDINEITVETQFRSAFPLLKTFEIKFTHSYRSSFMDYYDFLYELIYGYPEEYERKVRPGNKKKLKQWKKQRKTIIKYCIPLK
ncbi:unnamed protein product, partial [Didymodactylos carnosus]